MVVSKKEMEQVGSMTQAQRWQVEALELHIDSRLREEYTSGGQVLVHIPNYHMDARARKLIATRYREQGWKISFESDLGDGYGITLE